jgi:hypothetical protein
MTNFFSVEEEKDDPERAHKLVAGLEEVPHGLVQRMERIGGGSAADITKSTSDVPNCAVCWESLLDQEGGGFTVPDVGASTAGEADGNGDTAGEDPTTQNADIGRTSHPASNEPTSSGTDTSKHPTIIALPCSHVFHAACLIPWFARPKHTTCPTCRFDIDPDNLTRRARAFSSRGAPRDPPAASAPAQDPARAPRQPTPPPSSGASEVAPPVAAASGVGLTNGPANPIPSDVRNDTFEGQVDPREPDIQDGTFMNNPPPPGMNGFFVDVSLSVEPIPFAAGGPLRPDRAPAPTVLGNTTPTTEHQMRSDAPAVGEGGPVLPPSEADLRGIFMSAMSRALAQSFAQALGEIAANGPPVPTGDGAGTDPGHTPPVPPETTPAASDPATQRPAPSPSASPRRGLFGPAPHIGRGDFPGPGAHPLVFGPFTFGAGPDTSPPGPQPTRDANDGPAPPNAGMQGLNFGFPFRIPSGLFFGGGGRRPASETVAPRPPPREWAPPPAPGPTLRQRIEKRERELGLRCWDVSCGIGPSDEYPCPDVSTCGTKQIAVCAPAGGLPVCDHRFHPACLVVAERIAGGEHAAVAGEVPAVCAVCRTSGIITQQQWDDGVRALAT